MLKPFNLKDSINFNEPSQITPEFTSNPIDYTVTFSRNSYNYCIGLIDMVNSTKISAHLTPLNLAKYYEIFLNSMSKIISKYGGYVIKNIGDCLVYCFSEASISAKKSEFLACIKSGFEMVESHNTICEELQSHHLPCVNYRISMDYGPVMIMKTNHSTSLDMIGTPINMCSKINSLALPNQIVVGGDFYQIIKDVGYMFHEIKGFSIGLKQTYPVYAITKGKCS